MERRNLKIVDPVWLDEVDHFVQDHNNFKIVINRAPMGNLCGYVGVPVGHPLYAIDYDDRRTHFINVHGGLTFSGWYHDMFNQETETGERLNYWYLGFDTAHAGDLVPELYELGIGYGTYKSLDYLYEECKEMIKQLENKTT